MLILSSHFGSCSEPLHYPGVYALGEIKTAKIANSWMVQSGIQPSEIDKPLEVGGAQGYLAHKKTPLHRTLQ
jgi:hypothetical protein